MSGLVDVSVDGVAQLRWTTSPLLEKGLLVAHQFCLLMAHYWCATSTTPLVFFTNGAPLVRH